MVSFAIQQMYLAYGIVKPWRTQWEQDRPRVCVHVQKRKRGRVSPRRGENILVDLI